MSKSTLSSEKKEQFIQLLKERFEANHHRHEKIEWSRVEERLRQDEKKLGSLYQMEETQGEPDVIGYNNDSDLFLFVDCAKESPKGRRSLCYDQEALDARKKFKPKNSIITVANEMGVQLLDENQYKQLQQLESFDTKTSSWLHTPDKIRRLGGAIFGDFRFGTVFIYHNGAESYYASRGFRAMLNV